MHPLRGQGRMRFIGITGIPDLWLYNAILTVRHSDEADYTLNKTMGTVSSR